MAANKKLSEVQEANLVERYLAFNTIRSIAKYYGIHTETVVNILDRRGVQRRGRCDAAKKLLFISPEEISKRARIEKLRTLKKLCNGCKHCLDDVGNDEE